MTDFRAASPSAPRCCWSRSATRSWRAPRIRWPRMGLSGRQYMVLAVLSADDAAVAAGARRPVRAAPGAGRAGDRRARGARVRRPHALGDRPPALVVSLTEAGREAWSRPTRWAARWSSSSIRRPPTWSSRPCRVLTIRRAWSRPSVGRMTAKPIPEGYHTLTPDPHRRRRRRGARLLRARVRRRGRPQARHGRQAHALRAADRRLDLLGQRPVRGLRARPRRTPTRRSRVSILIYTEDVDALYDRARRGRRDRAQPPVATSSTATARARCGPVRPPLDDRHAHRGHVRGGDAAAHRGGDGRRLSDASARRRRPRAARRARPGRAGGRSRPRRRRSACRAARCRAARCPGRGSRG